jgi:hypothetical protein
VGWSRAKQAAYQKAYDEQNKAQILARQKAYRKVYYQAHREQILARVKASQAKRKQQRYGVPVSV